MNSSIVSRVLSPASQVPLICLCLVLMVFAIYGQTLRHGFVNFDDDLYVTANEHVSKGLTVDNLKWVCEAGLSGDLSDADNWIPLTMVSHMLDVHFFGLRPGAHHLVNVLLHALNSIGLFLILRTMTGSIARSGMVAALFAVHPLHVESVAWVAERKDVLSGFFFMLTLGAYLRYVLRPFGWGNYVLLLLVFALGLLSKPMLVTLPFLLLLLDWWPLARFRVLSLWRLLIEKLPLLALSGCDSLITIHSQRNYIADASQLLSTRLINSAVGYRAYLYETVWPFDLCVLNLPPRHGWALTLTALSFLVLVCLSLTALLLSRRRPYLLVGWLWYLGMLVPVIGVIKVGNQAYADRYTYLPLIGIFIAITWLVADWNREGKLRLPRRFLEGFCVLLLGLFMARSFNQTTHWKDSWTLWNHALKISKESPVAENNFGMALVEKGRIAEAIPHLENAIALSPDYVVARNNLGGALSVMNRQEEAINQCREALRIKPHFAMAHRNWGLALERLGRRDEALEHYRRAIEIEPNQQLALINLGNLLLGIGRAGESEPYFQKVLDLNPSNSAALYGLGKALYQQGMRREGVVRMEQAQKMGEDSPEFVNDLAWMLATAPEKDLRNGERALYLALRLKSYADKKNPCYLDTIAAVYAENGDYTNAFQTAVNALKLAESEGNQELMKSLRIEILHYKEYKPLP